MKELSIKEKVKAYDEALKRAVVAHKDEDRHLKAALERIFPELKESEDEKIRKAIHIYLDWLDGRKDYAPRGEYTIRDMIAWLEKQSTPQVRTGLEWVNTIDDACDKRYAEEYAHGEYCHEQSFKWGFQEGVEWLENQGEHVEINPTEFDTRLQALIGKFETLPKEELVGSLSFWLNVVQNNGTYKADEKQDKQNPCETCEEPRLNCQNFPCERKKNFKPAEWSEKDKDNIQRALYYVDYYQTHEADTKEAEECFDWLKSLRPKNKCVYNPYKAVVESIAEMCKHYDIASHSALRDFYQNVKVKCKDAKEYDSMFPQNTWKPSDEQMEALANALSLAKNCGEENAFDLRTLYEQLKKL